MTEENAPELAAPLLCELLQARAGDPDDSPPMVDTPDGERPAYSDFIASTAGVNRNGDAIDQNTWKLKAYRDNPQILWMHDRRRPPIGRGEARIMDRGTDKARLVIRVHYDLEDAFAREIAGKVHRGFIKAGSISAAPGKGSAWRMNLDKDHPYYQERGYGRYVKHAELLEFSLVTVPGDANALKLAAEAAAAAAAPSSTPPASPPAPTTNPEPCMDYRAALLSVLALSAESTDEEITAAADTHTTNHTALAGAVCNALGTETLPEDYAAQLAAATDRSGLITLSEANELVKAAASATDPIVEARAAVEAAVQSGAIAPAMKAHYLELAEANAAACTAAVQGLKPAGTVPLKPQERPEDLGAPVRLSALDRKTMKLMGLSEAEFLAAKGA